MAGFNKVILVGYLTRDPELKYTQNETPVANFGLAVNRRWKDRDGNAQEDVCFVDCRCYGKQAEVINQYMKKGRPILIEGRLELDTWEGPDGTRRSKHRVFVERFTFLGDGQQQPAQQPQQPVQPRPSQQAPQTTPPPSDPDVDDAPPGGDIPF